MENLKEIRKCQYSRKKCYTDANPLSKFCSLHEENRIKCRYICPSTHVQCNSNSFENYGFCKTHKAFLDRNRQRYHAFEQKYCSVLPAHKRENEVDFVGDQLNSYIEHARYVDLLSRPDTICPVGNAGIYSLSEIENIKIATNNILQSRLKEARNLFQQRAHSAAYALDEEMKERTTNDEKFMIVTNSSAETAVALQTIIDDHKTKIKELPVPDKSELQHPAQRQKNKIRADYNMNGFDNYCHYSEIRRNVKTSSILKEEKEESLEKVVEETVKFILDFLDREPEPVAYISERLCTNQKIKGFNHCFKHLWKEVSTLKKCNECDSTCTLASNVCGKCLKPFIDLKTENMVYFSDEDEDIPTVSIGSTDNDLIAVLSDCTKKLKESVEEDKDSDLEIASPHKYDTTKLSEQKLLEFMWHDMLKFGLECDRVTVGEEMKTNVGSPASVPLTYNRMYDIDEMIAKPSADEPSQPDIERITFCHADERKPMVLRFPIKTLSEKVTSHLDKSPKIAIGIEDPSQLPAQFRPPSVLAPQPVVNTVQQKNQSQPRPTYFSPSTANTIRLIRNVNPAASSNHQYMYPSGNRHGTPNIHNPRPLPYSRQVRLIRPNPYPHVRYIFENISYVPSHQPVTYASNPTASSSNPQGYDTPATSYVYLGNAPVVQQPPIFRRPLPRQS